MRIKNKREKNEWAVARLDAEYAEAHRIRLQNERREHESLCAFAVFADQSQGRCRPEAECPVRTCFQRDRDRVLHAKSFRRLKHKTQVFLSPDGDHYRTRLTHTLEVSQIAQTIARALCLNEDLTEAIALGHDLGHTPFGHAGEYILNEICEDGFAHFKQSVRIVEVLEKKGQGLNLTKEVRDGILNHRTSGNPATLEGKIVRFSDKIAYINHDIDDAIRGKIITEKDIPREFADVLGDTVKDRLNIMIHDIISNSMDKPSIFMSPDVERAMRGMREWMFEHVYRNPAAKGEEGRAQQLIVTLYEYYLKHVDELPEEFRMMMETRGEKKERVVCDYIAGMSDGYAIDRFEELFVPKAWKI